MSKSTRSLFQVQPHLLARLALALPVVLFTGCGIANVATPGPGPALTGAVHGGQQPVAGATITLYAAGLTGNGLGAVNLLGQNVVTTTPAGNFTITASQYNCSTATTPVYLVARGGNPGLTTGTNPSIVMVAALGDCSSFGNNFVDINEVTTAAAAWSLSQFFGTGAIAGASPTNLTGLRNAFATAATLVDSSKGTSPGTSLPTGTVVESAKLYSLANSLASCVNSDGTTGCQPLYAAATVAGAAPTNPFDAALNIVRNPAANVPDVFKAAGTTPPFASGLTKAPNDWTMSVTYGNCTTSCGGLNIPGDLAIDATGNIWVANYNGAVVSEFSPTGVPAALNGFPGTALYQSYGITIDPSGNAWVTNEPGKARFGSISKFNSSGAELSGSGYTAGGIYYPISIASTSTGLLWVADHSDSSATLLANDGSALSGNGYASSALPFTTAVAVGASQNAWFAAQKLVGSVTPAGTVTTYPCCSTNPAGIAVDSSSNVWVADYGNFSIVKLNPVTGITTNISTGAGLAAAEGIAIDGSGNVWTSNYFGNSITALTGVTAAVRSPTAGFGLDASLNEPFGIAIDAGGNLWLSNSGNNTLTEIIGLAAPIKTPLLGPPSQP